jgi:CRISPR/Cas system-associated endonuclease Cas1
MFFYYFSNQHPYKRFFFISRQKITIHFLDQPTPPTSSSSGRNDAKDIKLREKEAELARMQQMLEQMQQQLKLQQKSGSGKI